MRVELAVPVGHRLALARTAHLHRQRHLQRASALERLAEPRAVDEHRRPPAEELAALLRPQDGHAVLELRHERLGGLVAARHRVHRREVVAVEPLVGRLPPVVHGRPVAQALRVVPQLRVLAALGPAPPAEVLDRHGVPHRGQLHHKAMHLLRHRGHRRRRHALDVRACLQPHRPPGVLPARAHGLVRLEYPPAQHAAQRWVEVDGASQEAHGAVHVAVLALEQTPCLHEPPVVPVLQDASREGAARLVDPAGAPMVESREQVRLARPVVGDGNLVGTLGVVEGASFDGPVGEGEQPLLGVRVAHHDGRGVAPGCGGMAGREEPVRPTKERQEEDHGRMPVPRYPQLGTSGCPCVGRKAMAGWRGVETPQVGRAA